MKKSLFATITLVLIVSSSLFAQMSEREKFTEALYLMDEKRFMEAMPYLEELLESNPDNANLNYNYGVALANSFHDDDRDSALKYLSKAVENVSPNYTPYTPREKKAPVDAYYYYGLALHADNQFDAAIKAFSDFEEYINEKHYLYEQVENRILQANYAKRAIEDPRQVEITNLGGQLNSEFPEYSPAIRIDESAIYFTSRRLRPDSSNLGLIDPIDGMYHEDLYVSFNEDGNWSEPRLLNISTTGNEATLNLSADGRTLYIYKGDNNNGALLESKLLSDSAGYETWSKPKLLGSDINTKANESHVTISPDNKTLYFTSDREDGFGGMDIYFCRMLPNGKWAEALNAGPILNTKFNEDGLYMHPDGKTLYFSSDGHEGMGGYDLFTSTITDSGWTTPANLGYPINSVDDDIFFVTTPDGKRAYFSSFKSGGKGEKDIYMLQLIDAEEINLTLYRGEFVDMKTNKPPKGATVSITNNYTGELVGYYSPREKDGQFSAILEPNNSYHFIYEADEFETYEEDIYVPEGASYQEIYKDIRLKPVRVGDGSAGITPVVLAKAKVDGTLTTNDTAVANQKIILTDEQGNTITETTTNQNGEFSIEDLDPSKTYQIKLDDAPKASFLVYDLSLNNDRNEDLVYNKKDNKTVVFVPSKYPYEFYGITATAIAGTVLGSDGKPIEGLNVILKDNSQNNVGTSVTNRFGEFNFQKLSADNQYRLVFDGEFPDDPQITIINEFGEEMTFRQVSKGVFEYVPPTEDAKEKQINGRFTAGGAPLVGLSVLLEDGEGNVIQQQVTNENGEFVFANLDMDKGYRIVFDGDFPDDPELVITNGNGEKLVFRRTGKGVYEYIPDADIKGSQIAGVVSKYNRPVSNLKVKLSDGTNILQEVITDAKGEFTFRELDLEKSYRIIFDGDYPNNPDLILMNEFGQELRFHRVGDGVYEYIPGKKSKKGTEFKGTATLAGKPLANALVKLQNDKGETYQQVQTDSAGQFQFKHLDLNNSYVLQFDGEYPDDPVITVTNEYGQELAFVRTGNGRYEYMPQGKSKNGSVIAAVATKGDAPISGAKVKLLDENGNLIDTQQTNDQGKFNFTQLNLDRSYTLVFDGDFPDEAILILKNEYGEELTFVKVRDGEYEYVPKSKYKNGSVIVASVKKDGAPLAGIKVQLLDAQGREVNTQVTNDQGNFVFTQLNLDNKYIIQFEGDFPEDAVLYFTNEAGEELTFVKVGEGRYEYVPRKASASGSVIAAEVSKGGAPIAGANVKLLDSEGNLIDTQQTNDQGKFNFTQLNLDRSYTLLFEGDFPDEAILILKNEYGEELTFVKVRDGEYEYVPKSKYKNGSVIVASVKKDGAPLAGIKVQLLDAQGREVNTQVTNDQGNFVFTQLNLDNKYIIQFEGDFPDDAVLYFTNEAGEELTFVKVGEGRYEYLPGGKGQKGSAIAATVKKDGVALVGVTVNLKDAKGEIIETQKTNDEGKFTFTQLDLDRRYKVEFEGEFPDNPDIVFTNEFGDELTFMEVRKGLYQYVPRPLGFPLKSYTLGVKDEVAYKDTYPQPEELKDVIAYFQKYFPYNAKDITESNNEFQSFIKDIAEIVEKRGFAQIIITSSASKVPTRTWKSNSILTKRRAYDTKRLLEKLFKSKGLTEDQYHFVDVNTLITGPDYKNDALKNKTTYEKHQYVRIFIK